MRVAVTGAGGRLGTSLVRQLTDAPAVGEVLAWDVPVHNLDDPVSASRLVTLHRPDVVVHAAAWTDVDGCAHDPELAMRRNGTATGEMAQACADTGAAFVMVSTNEVFDGRRTDGLTYGPTDLPNPSNPYGAAKLAGETAARAAFGATGEDFAAAATAGAEGRAGAGAAVSVGAVPALAIIRTAWLFGLPGLDFPQKIIAAAEKARATGQTLSLVSDEVGCPTYAQDLAGAIVALIAEWSRPGGRSLGGIHHVVNTGRASRADWAREILRLAAIDVATIDVPLATWPRPSTPPAWGVLEPTPLPGGLLRSWQDAAAEYMTLLTRRMETQR
jgi:dTDP-4-dehydrorhamnose reductase